MRVLTFSLLILIKFSYAYEPSFSKFKLGLELQEINHLCPWAREDQAVQKKELFTVSCKDSNHKLWHLVIDTSDIEFVTVPFFSDGTQVCADEQEELLKRCMNSIKRSLEVLKGHLENENNELIIKEEEQSEQLQEKQKQMKQLEAQLEAESKELKTITDQSEASIEKLSLLEDHIETLRALIRVMPADREEEKQSYSKKLQEKEEELYITKFIKEDWLVALNLKRTKKQRTKDELADIRFELETIQKEQQQLAKKTPSIRFEDWFSQLNDDVVFRKDCSIEQNKNYFALIAKKDVVLPTKYKREEFWSPAFSPQVTIQHPLRITIPLYFYLFGFSKSHEGKKDYPHLFTTAMPDLDLLIKAQRDHVKQPYETAEEKGQAESSKPREKDAVSPPIASLCSELNGLIFLHALTLVSIADSIQQREDDNENDRQSLDLSLKDHEKFNQIDAKMYTLLMPRLSFSDMLRQLYEARRLPEPFSFEESYHKKIIESNNLFMSQEIPSYFYKVNYGEQFLDETQQPLDLTYLCQFFNQPFYQQNKGVLLKLLKKGIITTAMIRNFEASYVPKTQESIPIINALFKNAIRTVEFPSVRYQITPLSEASAREEGEKILFESKHTLSFEKMEYKHDALSPPWFLSLNDSMGALSRSQTKTDFNFGEAIIEIREIADLNPYFFENYHCYTNKEPISGVAPSRGRFLRSPENIMIHASWLFCFLQCFEAGLESNLGNNLVTGILEKIKEKSYINK